MSERTPGAKIAIIVDAAKAAPRGWWRMKRPKVFLETSPARKREFQERLTAMRPGWFGKADSNTKYGLHAEILDGYVAESEGVRRGLLLLKQSSPVGAEVYWMAVDPTCHRSGIGPLIETAAETARTRGVRYLFVATLHPEIPYERPTRQPSGLTYCVREPMRSQTSVATICLPMNGLTNGAVL